MGTEVLRPHDCLIRPIPAFRNPDANPNPRASRKRREGAKRERVTILKRGEGSPEGKETAVKGGGSREIRVAEGDGYAGSACAASPSPRAVPMPSFWRKGEGIVVDYSATMDLRRLLRLED